MADFSYEVMTATGQRSSGTLTATNEREALAMLDARGLFPLKVEQAKATGLGKLNLGGKVSTRTMATFYSQTADLLHSGVPLLRCLELLEKQSSNKSLCSVLREVKAKVADGTTLADAMAENPNAFTELAVSMVRAGQEGGFLEDVLKRIASFTEHQEDLKSRIVGALAYPVFLAVMGTIVLNVLVVFFVPKFETIFQRLEEKGELPLLTKGLIGVSHTMRSYWYLLILGGVGCWWLFSQWSRGAQARLMLDGWRLRLPIAGRIYLSFALARFTRILGTLLHNGIPILNALRISKDSTGNKVLTQAIEHSAENVTAGNKLAAPLASCRFIPRDVVEMIAIGEESNNLDKVLVDIADALEKRSSRNLDLFVRLLEPMLLLLMALITLIVVAGLLLPVFKMSSIAR